MARMGMKDQDPALEALRRECARLGLKADADVLEKLRTYLALLAVWNRSTNLVGARDWRGMLALAADSFHLAAFLDEHLDRPDPLALDLGAGAGLPGIPLRMLWKKGRYLLVEARRKRAAFMRNALARLGLDSVEVFEGRAEDLEPGSADLVLGRAFMPWPEYLALARVLISKAGKVLVMAGEPAPEWTPGWRLEASREYEVDGKRRYFRLFISESMSM